MTNLSTLMPQAEEIAGMIDNLMIDELGLMAPAAYELKMREKRIYLVGHYDPVMMGRSLRAYENPEIARRLQNAIGKPVHINKQTGTRYVVLMQGCLSLLRSAKFPFNQGYERDVFKLGIGAKGEITLPAREMLNVMIGAAQGSGKSTILDLLTYQMLVFGWRLYLADPQQHTFSPGLWNDRIAMPVAGSHADMIKVLNAIESERATRVHRFQRAAQGGRAPKDIDAYNALGIEPLPRIGFVSDESNFYLENKAIFHRFAEILREGRKFGLHIVVAAHEWHKDSIKSGVNDLFQTRIALNSLSGSVVLRNHQWGKWVEGRPPGRGVLKTNKFEPIQFYLLEEAGQETKLSSEICPVPDNELQLLLLRFGETRFDHSSLTEEIPDGLAGGVLLSVKAYSNADYSIQLSKSIKRGIADRVKQGYNNGGQAPRGYKVVRIYQDSQRANGVKRVGIRWEPDPELAPLVVLAWKMRGQGKGYAEITHATGGKIYKTKNSWATHFRNKSYLGIGKAGGIEIPDHHTPIITWELWEAVKKVEAAMPSQATRGAQGNPYHPRRLRHPSLLSGLSFCIYCGAAMVLHTARDYRSYQCGKRDRQRAIKDCTQARSVNARTADRVVLDTVLKRILSPTFVESLLGEIQSHLMGIGKIDQEISNTNTLLVSTERSISRLLSLAEESGEIKEIAVRLKQLRQERAEYNARIIQLKATRAVDVPDISLEALSAVFSVWRHEIETAIQSGDILTAKRLLAQFISKIELCREKAIIHYTFPLGIPSDGESGLSAHKSPEYSGLFFFCLA